MNRFVIGYGHSLRHFSWLLCLALTVTVIGIVVTPGPHVAACSASQVTATDGSCCNPGQYHISSGTIVCTPGSNCSDNNPPETCLITTYVNPAILLLSSLVGVLVVASIIQGAIQYITSEGDPGKAAGGKKKITNAIIGLVAFLLLFAFLQFILPGGVLNGQ